MDVDVTLSHYFVLFEHRVSHTHHFSFHWNGCSFHHCGVVSKDALINLHDSIRNINCPSFWFRSHRTFISLKAAFSVKIKVNGGQWDIEEVWCYLRDTKKLPEMNMAPPFSSISSSDSQFPFSRVNPSIEIRFFISPLLSSDVTVKNLCSSVWKKTKMRSSHPKKKTEMLSFSLSLTEIYSCARANDGNVVEEIWIERKRMKSVSTEKIKNRNERWRKIGKD